MIRSASHGLNTTKVGRTLAHGPLGTIGQRILPPRLKIMLQHYYYCGRFPNLKLPRTLNEKIQYRKLHDRDSRYAPLIDKISAKEHVATKIGSEWIIPTLWCGSDPANIPFETLTPPYVVKASHSSNCIAFVLTEHDVDPDRIRAVASRWLKLNHARKAHEWAYSLVQPGLLIEPYIGDVSSTPIDYKMLVYHGHVHYVEVCIERGTSDEAWGCFDRNWNRHDAYTDWPDAGKDLAKPKNLQRMIAAAETLVCDFDFARVDLYEVDDQPLFGEVTFYPEAGYTSTYKAEHMKELGDLWKL